MKSFQFMLRLGWVSFWLGEQPVKWRCFHCGAGFNDQAAAREHFGPKMFDTPACQVDATHLRALEKQLAAYREEDTDLHRQIHRLNSEHATDLRRAEEDGYNRGLADGKNATYTYASSQATNCAGCGEYKHTPLRNDEMGAMSALPA